MPHLRKDGRPFWKEGEKTAPDKLRNQRVLYSNSLGNYSTLLGPVSVSIKIKIVTDSNLCKIKQFACKALSSEHGCKVPASYNFNLLVFPSFFHTKASLVTFFLSCFVCTFFSINGAPQGITHLVKNFERGRLHSKKKKKKNPFRRHTST